MNPLARLHWLLRWTLYLGLWLFLSCVFAAQLFLADFVTPWRRAFFGELLYWLSWWILLPAVFWWCRWLRVFGWGVRLPGLVLGAGIVLFAQALIVDAIMLVTASLQLCEGCWPMAAPFSPAWLKQIVRVAGVNLPVYAGFVLGWHAVTFHNEARDRQMKAVELESHLHQAQLQALRSQLNPHFLFNALHSMAELVHSSPKLAEQLIVRLGELLRKVLESSAAAEVPLAREIEFIRGYVEIEQMRLGERLSVSWHIDDDVLQARVPSLLLQPLVENAIQHGIAPMTSAGKLAIRARRDADVLCLEVRDSGPGIPPDVIAGNRGIGIANTRIRLERHFGERHAFELIHDQGTVARVRIPLVVP